MGRDPDPSIKPALLEKTLAYLLQYGIQDLSLRPLAKAVGTNARMLIYHFGSKEQLIVETLELAQTIQIATLTNSPSPKEDAEAELAYLWRWFCSDSFLAFGKLLFEVESQAINGNAYYAKFATNIIKGWIAFVESRFKKCDTATANLIVNTVSGLLIDKLVTGENERVDSSFSTFSDLLKQGNKI